MTAPGLTRRRFLVSAGAAVGLAAGLSSCGRSPETEQVVDRLIATLERSEHWRDLGRAYLETEPAERAVVDLARRLDDDLDVGSGTDKELAGRVAALIRDDFTSGRTVSIDGWVVSETEARLAALVALRR